MPISKYDKHFGGKKGSAAKARKSMLDQYGAQEGERIFYATVNKRASGAKDEEDGLVGTLRGKRKRTRRSDQARRAARTRHSKDRARQRRSPFGGGRVTKRGGAY